MKNYKRRGFSLVEALIALVIIAIVLGGIINAMLSTLYVELNSEGHMESRATANIFFSALEDFRAESDNAKKDMEAAFRGAFERLRAVERPDGNYALRWMTLSADQVEDGTKKVRLTVEHAGKKLVRSQTFLHDLNTAPVRHVRDRFVAGERQRAQ